jgi:NAD(P)-dependent dehydrogenase (short-subunit alcohol dehydrogenase family)
MQDLRNKIIVITGAAGGIGAATSGVLIGYGARVVVADVNMQAALRLVESLGEDATAVQIDVTDSSSVRQVVNDVVTRFGAIDVWVNNAGIAEDTLALNMSDETWQKTLSVNLTGTFYGAREAGRHMTKRGQGSIINISSIAAFTASRPEHHAAYDVTKAGVAHMVRALATEYAPRGVRVNAVAPGYTNTELLREVGSQSPEVMAQWLAAVPQNRLIEPDEIGQVIAFLSSGVSSAITGQVVLADAGFTAW